MQPPLPDAQLLTGVVVVVIVVGKVVVKTSVDAVVVVDVAIVVVASTQFFPSPVDEVNPGWHVQLYNVALSSLPEQKEFLPHCAEH